MIIISKLKTVGGSDVDGYSFEEVDDKHYNMLMRLHRPHVYQKGKYYYLNEEWTIEVIKDKSYAEAIDKLWLFLPHEFHITDALT